MDMPLVNFRGSIADRAVLRSYGGERRRKRGRVCLHGLGETRDIRETGKPADAGEDGFTGGAIGGRFRIFFDHEADLIEGCESEIDQLRTNFKIPVADLIEGGFEIVGEGRQLFKTEHGAGTLEGVESAKDASNEVHVRVVLIQLEKSRFQVNNDLAGFFPEALLELVGVIQDALRHRARGTPWLGGNWKVVETHMLE
jgi:hypothetical protein